MFTLKLDDSFDRILNQLENVDVLLLEPTLYIGGEVLTDLFDMNFAAEGPLWANLAARTQAEREQLGYDPQHPILERTGHLRYSVIDRTHPDHFEDIQMVGDGVIHLYEGSDHPNFDLLHAGGMNDSGRMVPARPMTVVHDFQTPYLDDALERIVDAALGDLK